MLPGYPSEPYGYQVPVSADAPWPALRRDHQNTGRSPIPTEYRGAERWSFQTGIDYLRAEGAHVVVQVQDRSRFALELCGPVLS